MPQKMPGEVASPLTPPGWKQPI